MKGVAVNADASLGDSQLPVEILIGRNHLVTIHRLEKLDRVVPSRLGLGQYFVCVFRDAN
jgi:hypothetical protein